VRKLALLPLLVLAWAQDFDPLKEAAEPLLGYQITLAYRPFGGMGFGVDEEGPYTLTYAGHGLHLTLGLRYRAGEAFSLEGNLFGSYTLLGEARDRGGEAWRGAGALGGEVGLEYRPQDLPGRPRLALRLGYPPWSLKGEVRVGVLRDPVAVSAALGLAWTRESPLVLTLGAGMGLLANEAWSLGMGAEVRVPLGVEVPAGEVYVRLGYVTDPEGGGQLGLRAAHGTSGFRLVLEASRALIR
jgi:hypothetical protein